MDALAPEHLRKVRCFYQNYGAVETGISRPLSSSRLMSTKLIPGFGIQRGRG